MSSIEIRKTNDYELIKKICTHPRSWEWLADDYSPKREEWEPVEDEKIIYLAAYAGLTPIGIFALIPDNTICWKCHICMLPMAYGPLAHEATLAMFDWTWQNTHCLRLVAYISEQNRTTIKFARSVGMEEYGLNPRSWMKRGVLHGQILLGISRPAEAT